MRFIDEVQIRVISGKGGDGCASFLREKFRPEGGPDGGDGGRGGDVCLVASKDRSTLLGLRGRAFWRARDGQPGMGKQRTGRTAEHVELNVPVGTRVYDDEGRMLADLVEDEQRWVAAKGGDGGMGNARFKTSTNRSPRRCTPGFPGEDRILRLELMLMADVGLLGFPNAGKSTLISRVSAARPKVADYPFTTLVPSLGVVRVSDYESFVMADIPGLVEGASQGTGLGHQFLRHVSRTRILLHLLSLSPTEQLSVGDRYRTIRHELEAFDPAIAGRPEQVVLTQRDLVDDEAALAAREELEACGVVGPIPAVSSVSGLGVRELVGRLWEQVGDILPE